MFDFLESIRNTIDAPWGIVLSCPVGIVSALHFTGGEPSSVQGARSDTIAREARNVAAANRNLLRPFGFFLSMVIGGGSFLYIMDRSLLVGLIDSLPF
jgi:hypothetical protein